MLNKDYYAAVDDYNSAVLHGIVKIASKMGISTIQSYAGLARTLKQSVLIPSVIDKYFTNTVCRVGGLTLKDIQKQVEELHTEAFDPLGLENDLTLDSPGRHKMRCGAEEHLYNPQTIHLSAGIHESEGIMSYSSSIHPLVNEEDKVQELDVDLLDFNYPRQRRFRSTKSRVWILS